MKKLIWISIVVILVGLFLSAAYFWLMAGIGLG
jgi:hypothetical protein